MTNALAAGIAIVALASGCCIGHAPRPPTETLTIAGPGFSPDPMTTSAQAGGPIAAGSLAPPEAGCNGNIPAMPQHILHLDAALPLLRVMVNGTGDTTLVVRGPNGVFYCNDDSGDPNNGLNPVVEIPSAGPGEYSVYVGAYSDDAMLSTYSIGFTTTPGTYPSQVVR